MSTVILDNEAIQALITPHHPKQRSVLAHIQAQAKRHHTAPKPTNVVPTTVRAEAGWDRADPSAANVNRLHIQDRPLTSDRANAAARLVALHGVSPADAHVGATVEVSESRPVVVLTSDPGDIEQVCPPGSARIIRV